MRVLVALAAPFIPLSSEFLSFVWLYFLFFRLHLMSFITSNLILRPIYDVGLLGSYFVLPNFGLASLLPCELFTSTFSGVLIFVFSVFDYHGAPIGCLWRFYWISVLRWVQCLSWRIGQRLSNVSSGVAEVSVLVCSVSCHVHYVHS